MRIQLSSRRRSFMTGPKSLQPELKDLDKKINVLACTPTLGPIENSL